MLDLQQLSLGASLVQLEICRPTFHLDPTALCGGSQNASQANHEALAGAADTIGRTCQSQPPSEDPEDACQGQ